MKEYRLTMAGELVRPTMDKKKTATRRLKDLHPVNEQPDAWEFVRFLMDTQSFGASTKQPTRCILNHHTANPATCYG